MISLICGTCGTKFQRKKRSDFGKVSYCSRPCQNEGQRTTANVKKICEFCGTLFLLKDKVQRFCSQSCSARFNNPKRPKKSKPIKQKIRHGDDYSLVTIKDLRDLLKTRNFHTRIRTNARTIYEQSGRPMECYACGYERGIDICHIKPVSAFNEDTPISIVNDISNLLALDKLCHWEFDNGFLEFE